MASRPMPPPEAARSRRKTLLLRRGYLSLGLRVGLLAFGLLMMFSQVFLLTRCSGMGMFPAVQDGDLILAYRLQRDYAKGDVVVCRQEGQIFLGRIVAREKDLVMMSDSGDLQVNGTTQGGQILYPTYARENSVYPLYVPEGMVYLLGDYRTQTRDSRDFGSVSLDDIQGKVITIVRRRGL